ncbi:uncharacterized protein LY89DRAFT_680343 [Mollisia scopiformis]|uniref:Uncharacterized protein n=1 Tax=Mollisia scopiformis TaxID=149040 RepID=A0A194XV84_MOLSC|nr:uncharacterized protein LY89DRAFT_680343 [Mollisia scopiformis]KUJ23622.1 hypothetical protein LY89DRAFT_680343 [Mollisia scopiformis]
MSATAAQQQKIRRFVWTGAIVAVTATGAWYGAGLKTDQEIKEKVKKQREATPAEKIAVLEEQRGALVAKRLGLEKKIQQLEMRAAGATREESMQGQERRR